MNTVLGNIVLETIKDRRSVRKYQNQQIKDEELKMIIEAGIYAPTANNDQPWHFTVIQNQKLIEHMNEEAKKSMQTSDVSWMREMGKNEKLNIFFHSPTVIVVSGRKTAISPLVDCCAAIQNMLLAAESMDIGTCWIGLAKFFFTNPKNIEKLNIPEGYQPYYAVSIGYKTSPNNKGPERNKNVVNYIK